MGSNETTRKNRILERNHSVEAIRNHWKEKGGEKDVKGIVEFKAYYLLESHQYRMHEISRFHRSQGYWYYLDGTVKSIAKVDQDTNKGKNAPCPCGSEKKYKRCCGKASF